MDEPHKIYSPMNELEYYREFQRLADENYQLKKLLRELASNSFWNKILDEEWLNQISKILEQDNLY